MADLANLAADRAPSPRPREATNVDAHVGSRMRQRRSLLGMSQGQLGEVLGLTFQQVQKYERGTNRVGASRLWDLARALNVPVSFFYDGLENEAAKDIAAPGPDPLAKRETIELVRAYYGIKDVAVRRRICDLLRSLGGKDPEAAG